MEMGAIGTAHVGSSRMERGPEDSRRKPHEALKDARGARPTCQCLLFPPRSDGLERRTGARSDEHEFLDDVATSVEGQVNLLEYIEI
jgi:hypothetical protein